MIFLWMVRNEKIFRRSSIKYWIFSIVAPIKSNIPCVWSWNCWNLFGSENEVGAIAALPPAPLPPPQTCLPPSPPLNCNYSSTVCFLVKILLVKLKKFFISACLKLNYGTIKQKWWMVEMEWWNLSKLVNNTLIGLTLIFLQLHNPLLPTFCWGKIDLQKTLFRRNE